jgi:hypothetical protein
MESIAIERLCCHPGPKYRVMVGDRPYFRLLSSVEVKTYRRYVGAVLGLLNVVIPMMPPLAWVKHKERLVGQAQDAYFEQQIKERFYYNNRPKTLTRRPKPKPKPKLKMDLVPRYTRGLAAGSVDTWTLKRRRERHERSHV